MLPFHAVPKMKQYTSFAAWKKDQSAKHQRLISALQRVVKAAAPELTKTVKWGQGCFADGAMHKLYIHTEEDHVQLGFYAGSKLDDPEGLLVGAGKYVRHVKVRSAADIQPEAFAALIRQVIS